MLKAYDANIVLAAHDVSDGGIVTALAEMAFAARGSAPLGIELEPSTRWASGIGTAGAYFGEAGAFIVEVENESRFNELTLRNGAKRATRIGKTIRDAALDHREQAL